MQKQKHCLFCEKASKPHNHIIVHFCCWLAQLNNRNPPCLLRKQVVLLKKWLRQQQQRERKKKAKMAVAPRERKHPSRSSSIFRSQFQRCVDCSTNPTQIEFFSRCTTRVGFLQRSTDGSNATIILSFLDGSSSCPDRNCIVDILLLLLFPTVFWLMLYMTLFAAG